MKKIMTEPIITVDDVMTSHVIMKDVFNYIGPKQYLCIAVKKQWLQPKWYEHKTTSVRYITATATLLEVAIGAGYRVNDHTIRIISGCGHLDTLDYALKRKIPNLLWPIDIAEPAACAGHIVILEYLDTRGYKWIQDRSAGIAAAKNGHIQCLKYLQRKGCTISHTTINAAADGGSLECLKFFVEKGHELTCEDMIAAISGGHVECVEYIHNMTSSKFLDALCHTTLLYDKKHRQGYLRCCILLCYLGYMSDLEFLHAAALAGNIEWFEHLRQGKGGVFNEDLMLCSMIRGVARSHGHGHIIQYLNMHGFS